MLEAHQILYATSPEGAIYVTISILEPVQDMISLMVSWPGSAGIDDVIILAVPGKDPKKIL